MASFEVRRHTGCQLAAISIAVPQPASCYTVMISLAIINLPSVTLKPDIMARHQLSESWDESWSIMASCRRTMAPGEADSRAIRRLIKTKHTPDDLRKACRKMQEAADLSYKAIEQRFDAEAKRYEAEMRPLFEEARLKQLANPKGAQQPDVRGFWRS